MVNIQARKSSFGDFFSHESLPYPPLSDDGNIRLGNKSLIVDTIIPTDAIYGVEFYPIVINMLDL